MKKLTMSLVATSLLIFAFNSYATGDGIMHGTSHQFPKSSGFKSEGNFWGGGNGGGYASGAGQDMESKTFSTGTSEGSFNSTFDGKKLNMDGNVSVSQGAGAFNSAQGGNGDHVGSYTSSEVSGGAGMNGMGRVWGGKPNNNHNNGNHNDNDHHHHDHNHDND